MESVPFFEGSVDNLQEFVVTTCEHNASYGRSRGIDIVSSGIAVLIPQLQSKISKILTLGCETLHRIPRLSDIIVHTCDVDGEVRADR